MALSSSKSFHVIRDIACAFLLCSIPAILTISLVHGYLDSSLAQFVPEGADQLYYWHEIATFSKVGFNGGHYGFEEMTAPASALGIGTYGAHSVWFDMVYGFVAKFTGWKFNSPPLFNLAFLTIGLGGMVWLMRPGWEFSLKASAILATFFYINFWIPLMLMEAFLYSICFIMAGLFYRLYSRFPKVTWRSDTTILFITIIFSGLMRYNYAMLFFIFFLLTDNPKTRGQWLAWSGKSLFAMTVPAFLYIFFASPYPYEPFTGSVFGERLYKNALTGDIAPLWNHFLINIKDTFNPQIFTPYHLLFLEMLLCMFIFPFLAFQYRDITDKRHYPPTHGLLYPLFYIISMGSIAFSLFFYYYTMVGYVGLRFFSSYFLMSTFLLLRTIGGKWCYVIIVFNLALSPLFLRDYQHTMNGSFNNFNYHFFKDEAATLANRMAYNKDSQDPWCNTIQTVGFFSLSTFLYGIPPGIAINDIRHDPNSSSPFLFNRPITKSFLARYILLSNGSSPLATSPGANLTFIASGTHWVLYLNKNSCCD